MKMNILKNPAQSYPKKNRSGSRNVHSIYNIQIVKVIEVCFFENFISNVSFKLTY
jgi:hypothetical protein